MAPLTTFRIGGPAALYLEPEGEDDLAAAGRAVAETDVPFVVIGKGSNLLVSDEGFPGLVLAAGARLPMGGARRGPADAPAGRCRCRPSRASPCIMTWRASNSGSRYRRPSAGPSA